MENRKIELQIDSSLKERYTHITEPVFYNDETGEATVSCGFMKSRRVTIARCVLGDFNVVAGSVVEPVVEVLNNENKPVLRCTDCWVREAFFIGTNFPEEYRKRV